jgi:casein kinase 1
MSYVRKLKFEQKPDYKFLKGLFDQAFVEMGFENDQRFEWHIVKEEKLNEKLKREKEIADEKNKKSLNKKLVNKREQ